MTPFTSPGMAWPCSFVASSSKTMVRSGAGSWLGLGVGLEPVSSLSSWSVNPVPSSVRTGSSATSCVPPPGSSAGSVFSPPAMPPPKFSSGPGGGAVPMTLLSSVLSSPLSLFESEFESSNPGVCTTVCWFVLFSFMLWGDVLWLCRFYNSIIVWFFVYCFMFLVVLSTPVQGVQGY